MTWTTVSVVEKTIVTDYNFHFVTQRYGDVAIELMSIQTWKTTQKEKPPIKKSIWVRYQKDAKGVDVPPPAVPVNIAQQGVNDLLAKLIVNITTEKKGKKK